MTPGLCSFQVPKISPPFLLSNAKDGFCLTPSKFSTSSTFLNVMGVVVQFEFNGILKLNTPNSPSITFGI